MTSRRNSIVAMLGRVRSRSSSSDAQEGPSNRIVRNASADRPRIRQQVASIVSERAPSEPDEELIDAGHNPDHIRFMNDHPIGAILIGIMRDNTELRQRVGHNESNLNIGQVASAFYTGMQLEEAQMAAKLQDSERAVGERIWQAKLNGHEASLSYPAPAYFSPYATLTTPAQLGQAMKLFPSGAGKFSGTKDHGMGVIEFLSSMNRAQGIANLSRGEFSNQLLESTTGKAHSLIVDWLGNNESIENIYYSLVTNFDKRTTVEEARAKLASYKALRTGSLAKVESDIMALASRASNSLPAGPSRTAFYNMEGVNALIRALPPSSQAMANNTFHSLSSEMNRACTFTELGKALKVYRSVIDQDIKANGATSYKEKDKVQSDKKSGKKGKSATSFGIAAGSAAAAPEASAPMVAAANAGGSNQTSAPAKVQSQGQNQGQQNKGKGNKGFQKGKKKGYGGGSAETPMYCSLCGNTSHTAAMGCDLITGDNGAPINIQPTQSVCGACPPSISPRLHHPQRLCPYRKGGLLEGTAL
jgi:hypothetical protein